MCESTGKTLFGLNRLGLVLVNSDFILPMWRQLSDTSKPACVSQVIRIRWRQRGTGEVGPAPEQFGPYRSVQSISETPGVTLIGLSRARLPVKPNARLPALGAIDWRLTTQRAPKS